MPHTSYNSLKTEWNEKGFKLPDEASTSNVRINRFNTKLLNIGNSLIELQVNAQHYKKSLDQKKRGEIYTGMRGNYFWSEYPESMERRRKQNQIFSAADKVKHEALNLLENEVRAEIVHLKENEKTENNKKEKNQAVIAELKKQITELEEYERQLKQDVKQAIEDFIEFQIRPGFSDSDIARAAKGGRSVGYAEEEKGVINEGKAPTAAEKKKETYTLEVPRTLHWVRGHNQVNINVTEETVGNGKRTAEFSLESKYTKKGALTASQRRELNIMKQDYMLKKGYARFDLEGDAESEKWRCQQLAEFAALSLERANEQMRLAEEGQPFHTNIIKIDKAIERLRALSVITPGMLHQIDALESVNHKLHTLQAKLLIKQVKNDKKFGLLEIEKPFDLVANTKKSAIAAQNLAIATKEKIALTLAQIFAEVSVTHLSSKDFDARFNKALVKLKQAHGEAQIAYDQADLVVNSLESQLNTYETMFGKDHPRFLTIKYTVEDARIKLQDAKNALEKIKGVIDSTTVDLKKRVDEIRSAVDAVPMGSVKIDIETAMKALRAANARSASASMIKIANAISTSEAATHILAGNNAAAAKVMTAKQAVPLIVADRDSLLAIVRASPESFAEIMLANDAALNVMIEENQKYFADAVLQSDEGLRSLMNASPAHFLKMLYEDDAVFSPVINTSLSYVHQVLDDDDALTGIIKVAPDHFLPLILANDDALRSIVMRKRSSPEFRSRVLKSDLGLAYLMKAAPGPFSKLILADDDCWAMMINNPAIRDRLISAVCSSKESLSYILEKERDAFLYVVKNNPASLEHLIKARSILVSEFLLSEEGLSSLGAIINFHPADTELVIQAHAESLKSIAEILAQAYMAEDPSLSNKDYPVQLALAQRVLRDNFSEGIVAAQNHDRLAVNNACIKAFRAVNPLITSRALNTLAQKAPGSVYDAIGEEKIGELLLEKCDPEMLVAAAQASSSDDLANFVGEIFTDGSDVAHLAILEGDNLIIASDVSYLLNQNQSQVFSAVRKDKEADNVVKKAFANGDIAFGTIQAADVVVEDDLKALLDNSAGAGFVREVIRSSGAKAETIIEAAAFAVVRDSAKDKNSAFTTAFADSVHASDAVRIMDAAKRAKGGNSSVTRPHQDLAGDIVYNAVSVASTRDIVIEAALQKLASAGDAIVESAIAKNTAVSLCEMIDIVILREIAKENPQVFKPPMTEATANDDDVRSAVSDIVFEMATVYNQNQSKELLIDQLIDGNGDVEAPEAGKDGVQVVNAGVKTSVSVVETRASVQEALNYFDEQFNKIYIENNKIIQNAQYSLEQVSKNAKGHRVTIKRTMSNKVRSFFDFQEKAYDRITARPHLQATKEMLAVNIEAVKNLNSMPVEELAQAKKLRDQLLKFKIDDEGKRVTEHNADTVLGKLMGSEALEAAAKKNEGAKALVIKLTKEYDAMRKVAPARIIAAGITGAINAVPGSAIPKELITHKIINGEENMPVGIGSSIERARAMAYVNLINSDEQLIIVRDTVPRDDAKIKAEVVAARYRVLSKDHGVDAARKAFIEAQASVITARKTKDPATIQAAIDKVHPIDIIQAPAVIRAMNDALDQTPEGKKAWEEVLEKDQTLLAKKATLESAKEAAKKAGVDFADLKVTQTGLESSIALLDRRIESIEAQAKEAKKLETELLQVEKARLEAPEPMASGSSPRPGASSSA